MVSTELGACEWFVWDLRRSNLLDRGRLDQIVSEFLTKHPRAEPPALAEFLVEQEVLTQFQAERLLQGKTQGFVLGPFTLMDALGSGSMGTVYKAINKNDNQWYAVKVLPRRSMWNVRLAKRKVRVFEQCKHHAVVPFVEVGTSGGMHYLAWTYMEGETLDKVVQRHAKLPVDLVAKYALQTAEGLDACHQKGLFHGLLKPSNLMVGADQEIHILDFGVGSLLAETEGESLVDTMSTANSFSSGLDCASPESIMEPTNLTPAGDQYSLGCVIYYCLTGRFPFPDGSAAEKMVAHQVKQPTPIRELVPDLPDAMVALVEKLMQKSPEARYSNTAEVIDALRPLAIAAKPPDRLQAVTAPRPTRPDLVGPKKKPLASALVETPPPSTRPTLNAAPRPDVGAGGIPTRQSLRGKPSAPEPQPAPEPVATEEDSPEKKSPATPPVAHTSPDYTAGHREHVSLEDRLGPIGVAFCAMILCAAVWLLTWKLF
jgi:serine/threonine-protein kinase